MFSNLKNYDLRTIELYIVIIFFASFFAFLAQYNLKRSGKDYRILALINYIISFMILAFFACFSAVGQDKEGYALIFTGMNIKKYSWQIEPGYYGLVLLIRKFTNNGDVFNGIISFLTLFFVYRGIWKWKNKLHIGLVIFIFSNCYYLQSYCLARMYLAMSILIYFSFLIAEKKYKKYLLVALLICTIHFSVIFVVMALLIAFFMEFQRKISYFDKLVIVFIGAVLFSLILTSLSGTLLRFAGSYFSRYSYYTITKNGIGLGWILDIIPFLMLLIFSKYLSEEKEMKNLGIGYLAMEIITSLLSYSIEIMGRARLTLTMPVVILLPYALNAYNKKRKNNQVSSNVKIKILNANILVPYQLMYALLVIYVILFLLLYLNGYMEADAIDNYKFIWQ